MGGKDDGGSGAGASSRVLTIESPWLGLSWFTSETRLSASKAWWDRWSGGCYWWAAAE